MISFRCPACGHRVYFENTSCEHCGAVLAFDPETANFEPGLGNYCTNRDIIGCNWVAQGDGPLCTPCAQNEIVPPRGDEDIRPRWAQAERAKKRLSWSLIQLQLWAASRHSRSPHLRYRLLSPAATLPDDTEKLIVGHADGLITLDISEASSAVVHKRRERLGEPYRTLLGHFRHETSHFLWDLLVRASSYLEPCRRMFGDERADYGDALKVHYDQGPPANWQQWHISSYASCHPWEDWAETCAHVLHMVDLVETDAAQNGTPIDPSTISFTDLLALWYPLVERLNMLNRSLGHDDAYPFVIGPNVETKLSFALDVLRPGSIGTPA